MRIRSKHDSKVFYEHWKTPLGSLSSSHYYLAAILHGSNQICFFFGLSERPFKKFHVMTLPWRTPYRIYQEQAYDVGLARYINRPSSRSKDTGYGPALRFWNTPFIQDLAEDSGYPLGPFSKKDAEEGRVCHHVILTTNDCVEFIELYDAGPSHWEYYENVTIKKLLKQYIKRLHQATDEWIVKDGKMVSTQKSRRS